MKTPRAFSVLEALVEPALRRAAAADLAARLGADDVLVLVRDAELGVLLPAPGFPGTLPGGKAWAELLELCRSPGVHRALVPYPPAGSTPVLAYVARDGTVLLLLGGKPSFEELEELAPAIPLLGAALRSESMAKLAAGEIAVAREAGRQAHALALALDRARAELERALDRSARLNERLTEADTRKNEFLAMLGHELRNPLAAISNAVAAMRLSAAPQARERAQDIVEHHARQLARIVDELLDVARITQGKLELQRAPTDVAAVARRAVEAVQPLADSKAQRLRTRCDERVVALADATRLEQMVANLLGNAAKYTAEGGALELDVRREEGSAVVRVRDNGQGIAREMLEHIFEPFVQLDSMPERTSAGLGIGLTLVRQLAKLHGGDVTVESELGRGSEFVLRLPALEPEPADAPARSPRVAEAVEDGAGRRRVLLVDDNVDATEMLAEILEAWGHETYRAADGPSGLRAAKQMRPEIVLLDIGLPGMDGYEVARALRADGETEGAYVVALSGYGMARDRERSRAAGFDLHLVKPVDVEELRRVVESAPGRRA